MGSGLESFLIGKENGSQKRRPWNVIPKAVTTPPGSNLKKLVVFVSLECSGVRMQAHLLRRGATVMVGEEGFEPSRPEGTGP